MMQPRPRVLTGLRANNDLTIGNYLGAVLPMVNLMKKHKDTHDFFMFVPDLHSFTTPIDHSQLYESVINNVKFYIAAGAVTKHTTVYRQSFIPAHSELTWILDCFTGMGEMGRMTQFKEKAAKRSMRLETMIDQITDENNEEKLAKLRTAKIEEEEIQSHAGDLNHLKKLLAEKSIIENPSVSVGLFNYPVLMAADILLYHATYVPVGDDQTQHLEFTRDIAERMNARFNNLFTVPLPVPKQHEFFGRNQGLRIRDLQNPTKKMSKSDESGKGVIFLTDSPEVAAKKIMGATTDSLGKITYDFAKQPGISNLLQLLALLTQRDQAAVNAMYQGQATYGPLKADVSKAMADFLRDFQTKLAAVKRSEVITTLETNEQTARAIATKTLLEVQKAVGLRAA